VDIYKLIRRRLEDYKDIAQKKGYFVPRGVRLNMRDIFLSRWAPEKLMALSGRELLYKMFGSKEDDSLTYWLESKHTNEFYSVAFGSISGGSIDKFFLFKYSRVNGGWIGRKLSNLDLSENEKVGMPEDYAIILATLIRDAIVKGAEEVEKLSLGEMSYDELETNLALIHNKFVSAIPSEISPYFDIPYNIFHRAWVHKYFHLLYPEYISDFHAKKALWFIPVSLAHKSKEGSYQNDGVLKQIISNAGYDNFLDVEFLNRAYPIVYKYVRLSTSDENIRLHLDEFINKGIFEWKTDLPAAIKNIKAGTRIYVVEGDNLIAYGYAKEAFSEGSVEIDWLLKDIGKPIKIANRQSVVQFYSDRLIKYADELISVEKSVMEAIYSDTSSVAVSSPVVKLPDDVDSLYTRLRRKKQIILYGPPGTGKTYLAMKAARYIVAKENFGRKYEEDLNADVSQYIAMVTFHPSYSYDDFVEGIKVEITESGNVAYHVKEGIFKEVSKKAMGDKDNVYIFIIDEINRGDTARIFGELITLLEADKREKVNVKLPLSGEKFTVPSNLYIIGTMNTSDRSIAMVDAALRRRFAFLRMWPDYSVLNATIEGIHLGRFLEYINDRLKESMGAGAQDLLIGHSYLMVGGEPIKDIVQLRHVLQSDIIPLLEEYFRGDMKAVREVLGEYIVDDEGKLIGSDEELVISILDKIGYTEDSEEDEDDNSDGVETLPSKE